MTLPRSQLSQTLTNGVLLNVEHDELAYLAYVVISEPDLDCLPGIVLQEHFESGADIHVAAIDSPESVAVTIQDIAFNMNPGDIVVFLCNDDPTYAGALHELGLQE